MSALTEYQKHICIVDQSKCSWRAVAAYKNNGIGIYQADKETQDEMAQEKKSEGEKQKKPSNTMALALPPFPHLQVLWTTVAPPTRSDTATPSATNVSGPLDSCQLEVDKVAYVSTVFSLGTIELSAPGWRATVSFE